MAKRKMREAAVKQVRQVARQVPAEHRERSTRRRQGMTERLVVRMSPDQLRRFVQYAQSRELPISTLARSILLEAVRRG